ncbi:MAG: DUF2946 family protein [Gemmobacter sp.]
MTWRAPLALILAALMALASQTMAVVRAQSAQSGITMVICSGYGLVTVTLDENGNPSGPVHPCPDCIAAVAAIAQPPVALPERPVTGARDLSPLRVQPAPSSPWRSARARAPPLSA